MTPEIIERLPNFLRRAGEARVATHDGFVWPVERKLMVDPACIRQCMVEDAIEDLRAWHGLTDAGQRAFDPATLRRWNQDQLFDHYGEAMREAYELFSGARAA